MVLWRGSLGGPRNALVLWGGLYTSSPNSPKINKVKNLQNCGWREKQTKICDQGLGIRDQGSGIRGKLKTKNQKPKTKN